MGGNALLPETVIKPIVESLGMEYIEISNRNEATIKWDRKRWATDMLIGDISVCPQDHWSFPAKSNVKVTSSIALGLPVLASPLRSYEEIIDHGYSGYICHTLEDWYYWLKELGSNKALRDSIRSQALKKIYPYKLEVIYSEWLALFNK